MEYRQLGRSGLKVSAVGLGANPFGLEVDEAGAAAVVNRALDLGVTFIDTANIYHAGRPEELVGKALRGRRHEVVLATKAAGAMGEGPNQRGASRKHLLDSVHDSLRRLQTDYVDLFQLHHPDPTTPAEETMRALEEALESFAGCAIVISHDRWFLDRVATHILAFEGDSRVYWFDGNYSEYEEDKRKRLGAEADQPHRIRYRQMTR